MAVTKSESRVQACIDVALEYFTVELNQPSIQSEMTLRAILSQCIARFSAIYALDDGDRLLADAANQKRVLDTIFDSDSRAFVTEDCIFMLEHLDDHAKTTLLSQAVGGLILIFQRLSTTGSKVTPGALSRELQLFAESEERHAMLGAIASSHVLQFCYMKGEIASLIVQAIKCEEHDDVPLTTMGQERLRDGVSWVSYRPCRDMGMPWGFTIMAIN
ncbi:hypothetical protein GQ53DRAFT_740951 [Thozetella sp. PMI_491]|nr:hypothetical protein GQ53DRAFT_740951 [Thozetella sp. PMI_491]